MPGAVFLSYSSDDIDAARRICESLRAAGIEVWFDQSELRGGDQWDAKIRKQIRECGLFVPVISANTNARGEGYFRLEWKLAVDRSHLMADDSAFIVPVLIDEMPDASARVPDRFREVQWTRLGRKASQDSFAARVTSLLGGKPGAQSTGGIDVRSGTSHPVQKERRPANRGVRPAAVVIAVVAIGICAIFWAVTRRPSGPPPANGTTESMAAASVSPARQLTQKAWAMFTKYDSNADDYVVAESMIKQALALDPNDAEIWATSSYLNTAMAGRGYTHSAERKEAARSQAEHALKLDPDSVRGLTALGFWQYGNDPDPSVAQRTLERVLQLEPNRPDATRILAGVYLRLGRESQALALYDRVAKDPAFFPLARYQEYLVYFGRRDFANAKRCLRESIAANPSANSVTGLVMVLLTANGDVSGAVKLLAEVPSAARNENRVVWMSAYAHLTARLPDAALEDLGRLPVDYIQDNWFTGPKDYWAGRAYAQAGRTEAAQIAFDTALSAMEEELKARPTDPQLRAIHGEILAWLGRDEDAVKEARTVAELRAAPITYWGASPVRIYAALGRANDAMPLLEMLCKSGTDWPLTPALLRVDPLWDKLRGDRRFQALVAEGKK